MSKALIANGSLSPGRDLDHYIHTISAFEILTPEAEQTLARQYRDEGDLEAARQLVLSHLRFVVHLARSYSGYGLAQADLIQEGNVGLMKAVKRFDPDYGVRLVSFAVHWIKAEIHEFILRNWRIVKVATTKAQRKLFFNLRQAKKSLGWLNPSEVSVVARDLGVPESDVIEMENRLASRDASFDPDPSEDDERGYLVPSEQLSGSPDSDPAQIIEDADWDRHYQTQLQQSLNALDARTRDILVRRYLIEPKATLHELASEYGVSAERIRQIENRAFKSLREALAA